MTKTSTFFHIIHNGDKDYEGRVYLDYFETFYPEVHGLPFELLINDKWNQKIINPSRCALLCTDQWGTVSKSYKSEISASSSLAELLEKFPEPFAYSNGIDRDGIKNGIVELFKGCDIETHKKAKALIQKTYFGLEEFDDEILLLTTIGRVVEQKQVHLILRAVESLIHELGGKVQILIAGNVSPGDPYGQDCMKKMAELKAKHPKQFWADPSYFFSEYRLQLFHGTDFGIMFSRFEPGGLAQFEYFSGSTPMIATMTGGLKDTIEPINEEEKKGSGIFIESNNPAALVTAVLKAKKIFENKEIYHAIRNGCYGYVIDTKRGALEYLQEFFRLKKRLFVNQWEERAFEELHEGHIPQEYISVEAPYHELRKITVKGSFDDWVHSYRMEKVDSTNRWILNQKISPGQHQVVFTVDDTIDYIDPKLPITVGEFRKHVNLVTIKE